MKLMKIYSCLLFVALSHSSDAQHTWLQQILHKVAANLDAFPQ